MVIMEYFKKKYPSWLLKTVFLWKSVHVRERILLAAFLINFVYVQFWRLSVDAGGFPFLQAIPSR